MLPSSSSFLFHCYLVVRSCLVLFKGVGLEAVILARGRTDSRPIGIDIACSRSSRAFPSIWCGGSWGQRREACPQSGSQAEYPITRRGNVRSTPPRTWSLDG